MSRAGIVVVITAACYAPTIPLNGACSTACPGGQVCHDHVCRDPGELPGGIDAPGDGDGDGVVDERDNCPAVANDQHDEDDDKAGDACDPCPHLAAVSQAARLADADDDGVGDACDPEPAVARQHWLVFDPLVASRSEWGGAGVFANDQLALAMGSAVITVQIAEVRITLGGQFVVGNVPRQNIVKLGVQPTGAFYYAEVYEDVAGEGHARISKTPDGQVFANVANRNLGTSIPSGDFTWIIDYSVALQTIAFSPTLAGMTVPQMQVTTSAPAIIDANFLELGTQNIVAEYRYLAIIATNR